MTLTATPFAEFRPPARKTYEELTAELERLRSEVARLRAGEEPAEIGQQLTTSGHLLWVLGESTPAMRAQLAANLLDCQKTAHACFEGDHERTLRRYRQRNERLEGRLLHAQKEARRMANVSSGAGRGVAMSLSWVLADHSRLTVL